MKTKRFVAFFVAAVLIITVCTACHKEENTPTTSTNTILNFKDLPTNDEMTMTVGETKDWTPFPNAESGIVFSNSDYRFVELHASKTYAVVEAVAVGESYITAQWNDQYFRVHVTVKPSDSGDVEISTIETATESTDGLDSIREKPDT